MFNRAEEQINSFNFSLDISSAKQKELELRSNVCWTSEQVKFDFE